SNRSRQWAVETRSVPRTSVPVMLLRTLSHWSGSSMVRGLICGYRLVCDPLPKNSTMGNLQQVGTQCRFEAQGAARARAGDAAEDAVLTLSHWSGSSMVRGLICGYRLVLVDLLNQINTRRRKTFPPRSTFAAAGRGG